MAGRSVEALGLEDLGLDRAPRDHPLLYPGAWPEASGLLDGDRLWPLDGDDFARAGRTPVLAVGSNACPGQLRHKMAESGIVSPVPMVKCVVIGLGIGVSARVSVMGYVSASPFLTPGAVRELLVTWFDAGQLAVIEASERAYDRAWPPGSDIRIETDAGERLPARSCTSTGTAYCTTAPARPADIRDSVRCSPNSSGNRRG
ncbi:hypothetical protein GCM10010121_017600 [Streptomyces brasiliensis]|uniref:Uncharacterized protein n=1 Tax=Streptomyces brasiliensis TaxID=1954 RepID=A0A917KB29_9ACTN|nr:hypothetical protein GCM10010121_017600 [Streptomyces brasiliensis]